MTDATFIVQIFIVVVFHQNRHVWDIPPNDLYNAQKLAFIYNILFAQSACQSKLSLLFFSRKIIGTSNFGSFYPHYICLLALITVVTLCEIFFVILSCVECQYVDLLSDSCGKLMFYSPLKAACDPHPTYSYKCFNTDIFLFITGVINTLTDFLCTVLPAFIVFKLHMPFHKRMSVASLFLVGISVNLASALRIYYLYDEAQTSDTWNLLPSSVCSNVEIGLGLVSSYLHSVSPKLD